MEGDLIMPESEQLQSRFFVDTDERSDHLVYDLPASWWSRPYEYAWCASFVSSDAIVLDAACGIGHPFKFYLDRHCRETHACDADLRIESTDGILEDARQHVGEAAARILENELTRPHRISLKLANLVSLPYVDASFDRIFCISVLEHLSPGDCAQALKEFSRTLASTGKLVLTFDYPTVNLEVLKRQIQDAGLHFCSTVDDTLPANAVHSTMWGDLYCFRAVLEKKTD
jgi:ubiquinone/menaquinone biosynthesis C-methylase UbiE